MDKNKFITDLINVSNLYIQQNKSIKFIRIHKKFYNMWKQIFQVNNKKELLAELNKITGYESVSKIIIS